MSRGKKDVGFVPRLAEPSAPSWSQATGPNVEPVRKMLQRYDSLKGKGGYPTTFDRYHMKRVLEEHAALYQAASTMLALVMLKYGNLDPDVNVATDQAREALSLAKGES